VAHLPARRGSENRRRLSLVLGLTSVFLFAEVAGGLLTRSLALLADAGHMLTDVAGLAMALVAMKFAERPPTPQRTYGYHRVEIVAAVVNAVVLIVISAYILCAGIGLFILPRTWTLLKEGVVVLLEGAPTDVDLEAVRQAMESVPGVETVHDLHVWTITSGMNALSAHFAVRDGASGPEVLEALQRCARTQFNLAHVTVQLEGEGCGDPDAHA